MHSLYSTFIYEISFQWFTFCITQLIHHMKFFHNNAIFTCFIQTWHLSLQVLYLYLINNFLFNHLNYSNNL